ncbi:Uncharacterised protein [Vibrio cholerae]|nr:Uncharacterised protein [Vibrio cholerae]
MLPNKILFSYAHLVQLWHLFSLGQLKCSIPNRSYIPMIISQIGEPHYLRKRNISAVLNGFLPWLSSFCLWWRFTSMAYHIPITLLSCAIVALCITDTAAGYRLA